MGWGSGIVNGREVGYLVDAECDLGGCTEAIDRGLAYVCGGMHGGGEHGCGGYFCGSHRFYAEWPVGGWLCQACIDGIDTELEAGDLVQCEGCQALLDPEYATLDVEGCWLCDECAEASRVPCGQPSAAPHAGARGPRAMANCPATVFVHDDRMGGWERSCSRPKGHRGEHSAPLNACEPVAVMRWTGTYTPPARLSTTDATRTARTDAS